MATYTRTIGSVSSHYTPTPGTSYDSTITFRLVASYTQNATNNTTTTSITITATNSNTNVPFKINSWSITGSGGTKSGTESTFSGSTRTKGTASTTFSHGTDGKGSFTSGASVKVTYYTGTGVSTTTTTLSIGNAVYTMPTIDVYSTLSFDTTTPTMGSNVVMTITKASCATSGVRIKASYDTTTTTIYEGSGTSYTWSVPNLASTTTTATSKAITITIQSVKDSTYYDAQTYTIDAQVPSSLVPTATIGTVSDNLSAITPFVIGYSKLTFPVTFSASDTGVTITAFNVEIRATNSSGAVLYSAGIPNPTSPVTVTMTSPVTTATTYIKVTVTDSRGRTTTTTKNVSASAYTKPSITVTAIRCNSSGTATTMGTYVKITVNWSITNLTGNAVNGNIITYKSSGGTYTSANSKAVTGTSGSYSAVLSGYPINTAYWFYSTIQDKISGAVNSPVISVPKASMPMSLYDNGTDVGISFGQMASEGGAHHHIKDVFYNGVPIEYRNGSTYTRSSLLDLIYPIGCIYLSVNNTNPATFLGGTWVQIKDVFLLGAGDTYSNGATGGEATHTLTVAEMPAHTHEYTTNNRGSGSNQAGRAYYGTNGGTSWQIETTSTGSGGAHNNMPPYLVVYMWKRTA